MPRYSETVMDHFGEPRNQGCMANPTAVGEASFDGARPCIHLYLLLEGRRVARASFQTQGCGALIAAGSALTELVTGLDCGQAAQLQVDDLLKALDGLPEQKRYCAVLAILALHRALDASDELAQ